MFDTSVPPRRAVSPVPSRPRRTSRPVPSHAPRAPCPSVAPFAPCPSIVPRAPFPSVAPHAPCPSVAPRAFCPSAPVAPVPHPSELTIEVLESALKDVESNLCSVASASGAIPPPLFHRCTIPQLPTFTASLAIAATDMTATSVTTYSRPRGKSGRRGSQGTSGGGGGGGGDVASGGGGSAEAGGAPRAAAGDSPAAAGGGDAQVRQPPTGLPAAGGGAAACLGASLADVPVASVDTSTGAATEDASLSFTLDSGASHCFSPNRTTLTPLPMPVFVALIDPTLGPITARYTTTLPCPAIPSGSLTGFHVPSFSRNLVGVRPVVSQHVDVWIEPSSKTAVCVDGDTVVAAAAAAALTAPDPCQCSPSGSRVSPGCRISPGSCAWPLACLAIVAAFACATRRSLRRGSAARHPSLLLLSSGHRALRDSPLGRLWPYAVRYAANQLNLWLRVSRPEVSPTSLWTVSPGAASHFRVWGCLALVHDTSVDKISPLAGHCRGLPVRPPPLFLTSAPPPAPPVQPPPPGPSPSGVSYTTPPPLVTPQVQPPSLQSSSQPTPDPAGAGFCGEDPGGASSRGAGAGAESVPVRGPGSGGAGVGAEPVAARDSSLGGAGVSGAVPGGATTGGAPSAGPREPGTDPVTSGGAGSGGGATGAAGVGARGERVGAAVAGATTTGGAAAATAAVAAARAGAAVAAAAAAAVDAASGGAAVAAGAAAAATSSSFVFPPPLPPLSPPLSHTWPSRRSPRAHPSSPVPFTDLRTALFRSCPPRSSLSVLPSPPESALIPSLSKLVTEYYRTYRPVLSHILASLVTDPRASLSSVSALTAAVTEFASARCLDYATSLVAAPPTSPLAVGGESALGCDALEDGQFELEFLGAAYPHLCAMLLAPKGDPDALALTLRQVKRPPGSPPVFKARYVARDFSHREGVDFFQNFVPTPKMTTLWELLHVAAPRDYELHSLDFSTAFLQGSLHEEIWLRRPSAFTSTFPRGT
ncbi:unnamed protein product [Closterium sp. NIES-53]